MEPGPATLVVGRRGRSVAVDLDLPPGAIRIEVRASCEGQGRFGRRLRSVDVAIVTAPPPGLSFELVDGEPILTNGTDRPIHGAGWMGNAFAVLEGQRGRRWGRVEGRGLCGNSGVGQPVAPGERILVTEGPQMGRPPVPEGPLRFRLRMSAEAHGRGWPAAHRGVWHDVNTIHELILPLTPAQIPRYPPDRR